MSTLGSQEEGIGQASSGKMRWLLPPAAAFLYPYALRALYESRRLLHEASGPGSVVAWLAIVVSVVLTYTVPFASIGVACAAFEPAELTRHNFRVACLFHS